MNMRFWPRPITMGGAGLSRALIDNAWVFTSIPLPGQRNSDDSGRIFYSLAEAIVTGILASDAGRMLDPENWNRPQAGFRIGR